MKVSRKGAKFVGVWEGFRSCPYRDAVGVWTIGYGDTNGVDWRTPCISERVARRNLRRALNGSYLAPVNSLGLDLKQHEIDALASAVYNLGPGLLADTTNSTIARRLRSREGRSYHGRREIYREELPKWANAGGQILPGLLARRRAEVRLANHADYSGHP